MEARVSVRGFVEFLLRSGDIDNRVRASSEQAMQEGGRIHRKIQQTRGADYHAEVPLSYTADTGRYLLRIEGRADGIFEEKEEEETRQLGFFDPQEEDTPAAKEKRCVVEEIKGTYRNVSKMEAPVPVHLAQAKCYAHFLCLRDHLSAAGVRMTYCNLDTEEIRFFHESYTAEELKLWFDALLVRYIVWTDWRHDHVARRNRSIRETVFPYAYRKGQKALAEGTYRTIVHKKKLFLEAPTGSGKTLAVLFPAVQAIGAGKAERLFYLTARTITRTAPEEALMLMRTGSGLHFLSITLTAKEKICPREQCLCNPEDCPYAKGHFDRVNDALYDILTKETHLSRETILRYAEKHTVCPFEYALDLTLFADGIICDYNYLFDPFVYLRRFFAEGEGKAHLFLVDEAHNLVERGREMYSAALGSAELEAAYALTEKTPPLRQVRTALRALIRRLGTYADEAYGTELVILPEIDAAYDRILKLHQTLSDYLDATGEIPHREEMLKLYLALFRFRTIYEGMDSRYRICAGFDARHAFQLRLRCLDPSGDLRACMARGVSSVLFSATLLPVQYYKRVLGGTAEDFEIYAETSFSPASCLRAVVRDVTSRYAVRSGESYRRIARAIAEVTAARRGNYIAYFPSFAFLEAVLAYYREELDEEREYLLVQRPDLDEEARERILSAFQSGEDAPLSLLPGTDFPVEEVEDTGTTLFAVLGGIFGEGIDLPGESLIGVCIVGCGLPAVCAERDMLRDYFDESGENGYDYAYRFPGMNHVLQAAGRVIRTERDRGVVALLDERFATKAYRSLFPREWKGIEVIGTEKVRQTFVQFWEKAGEQV